MHVEIFNYLAIKDEHPEHDAETLIGRFALLQKLLRESTPSQPPGERFNFTFACWYKGGLHLQYHLNLTAHLDQPIESIEVYESVATRPVEKNRRKLTKIEIFNTHATITSHEKDLEGKLIQTTKEELFLAHFQNTHILPSGALIDTVPEIKSIYDFVGRWLFLEGREAICLEQTYQIIHQSVAPVVFVREIDKGLTAQEICRFAHDLKHNLVPAQIVFSTSSEELIAHLPPWTVLSIPRRYKANHSKTQIGMM